MWKGIDMKIVIEGWVLKPNGKKKRIKRTIKVKKDWLSSA